MKVLIPIQDKLCVNVLSSFVIKYPWPKNTEFKILHVVHPVLVGDYMSILPSALTAGVFEERMRQGTLILKEFAKRLTDANIATSIEEMIVEGDSKAEVLSQIDEYKPDLVVVGSHGKTGLRMLGSVSRAIVAQSKCSVMVVPLASEEEHKMHIIV